MKTDSVNQKYELNFEPNL